MKRASFIRFLLAMLISMATSTVSAYDFEVGGIYYNITSSTAPRTVAVTSGDSKYTGDIAIPESVSYNGNDYNVTTIGDDAFLRCTDLTSVFIPSSVTEIGEFAFRECSNLSSVNIPNSVTCIGCAAFSWSGLTSVTIPNNLTNIGDLVFQGCRSLTSITIPNSVTSIDQGAFDGCI